MENVNKQAYKLTPIENYKMILLKRDDLFSINGINGGKLRQAIYLINQNLEVIKGKCNNEIICSCSIKSPQSAIISVVCKIYNIKCNIITYKTKKPNINLTIAQDNGAKIYGSPSGYTSVIESYAKKYFPQAFYINMGFVSEEVLKANIHQVENIPKGLDYIIVPIGSAMNFISILKGLDYYDNAPKKVIGVYVGKNPLPVIKTHLHFCPVPFHIIKYDKPYGHEVSIDNNFFDPIYEAKAYEWIIDNIDFIDNKVLMWVVGKRNLDVKPKKINYKTL